MNRIIQIKKIGPQYSYRIIDRIGDESWQVCDWQFGPCDAKACIDQARSRFSVAAATVEQL